MVGLIHEIGMSVGNGVGVRVAVGVGVRVGVSVGPLGLQRILSVLTPFASTDEMRVFAPAVPVPLIAYT